jgi:predicted enzyme related to lactoylglutathione lyase
MLKHKLLEEVEEMPTIVHFEIPTDDLERAKRFYTELFGWKIEKYPTPVVRGETQSPDEYQT